MNNHEDFVAGSAAVSTRRLPEEGAGLDGLASGKNCSRRFRAVRCFRAGVRPACKGDIRQSLGGLLLLSEPFLVLWLLTRMAPMSQKLDDSTTMSGALRRQIRNKSAVDVQRQAGGGYTAYW